MSVIEEVSLSMYENWQPRLLTCVRCGLQFREYQFVDEPIYLCAWCWGKFVR